jgi:hypothetical protein
VRARLKGLKAKGRGGNSPHRPVKRLLSDRVAVATAGVGIALMILTLVWRVNPVEGSVMPNFLTGNLFGMALLMGLLVTCMPVGIVALFSGILLGRLAGLSESEGLTVGSGLAIVLQGTVYFFLGRLISVIRAHFKGRT